jgi:hypothetical protein
MPQTKIEIKYFSHKIKNFFPNTNAIIRSNIVAQGFWALQINITGGEE